MGLPARRENFVGKVAQRVHCTFLSLMLDAVQSRVSEREKIGGQRRRKATRQDSAWLEDQVQCLGQQCGLKCPLPIPFQCDRQIVVSYESIVTRMGRVRSSSFTDRQSLRCSRV